MPSIKHVFLRIFDIGKKVASIILKKMHRRPEMKRHLVANYNGTEFKRETKRNYTHAAIHEFTFHTNLKDENGVVTYAIGQKFLEATFHGSEALAKKVISQHPWANGRVVAVIECRELA